MKRILTRMTGRYQEKSGPVHFTITQQFSVDDCKRPTSSALLVHHQCLRTRIPFLRRPRIAHHGCPRRNCGRRNGRDGRNGCPWTKGSTVCRSCPASRLWDGRKSHCHGSDDDGSWSWTGSRPLLHGCLWTTRSVAGSARNGCRWRQTCSSRQIS